MLYKSKVKETGLKNMQVGYHSEIHEVNCSQIANVITQINTVHFNNPYQDFKLTIMLQFDCGFTGLIYR